MVGYAILYKKGKHYVHRAIFYLNKHKENNMKLYQKKVLPALVSCQGPGEGKLYAEEERGGGWGGQDVEAPLRDFWLTVTALSWVPHPHSWLCLQRQCSRARIFKCLWGPGIDYKEWIPPAYVARTRIFKCLWSPGIDSKELIPPQFLAPIDYLKIPALAT